MSKYKAFKQRDFTSHMEKKRWLEIVTEDLFTQMLSSDLSPHSPEYQELYSDYRSLEAELLKL